MARLRYDDIGTLIANDWGEACQKQLPFYYTQWQKPLKDCGHIVQLFRADGVGRALCAICTAKQLPQGKGC
jgi:hypothetical protein